MMGLAEFAARHKKRGRLIHVLQLRIHRRRLAASKLKAQLRVYIQKDIEWAKTLTACLAIKQQFERLIAENNHLRRRVASLEEMSYQEKVRQLQDRVHELILQRRALLETQWTPPAYYSWPPIQKLIQWRMAYLRWRGHRGARV